MIDADTLRDIIAFCIGSALLLWLFFITRFETEEAEAEEAVIMVRAYRISGQHFRPVRARRRHG